MKNLYKKISNQGNSPFKTTTALSSLTFMKRLGM